MVLQRRDLLASRRLWGVRWIVMARIRRSEAGYFHQHGLSAGLRKVRHGARFSNESVASILDRNAEEKQSEALKFGFLGLYRPAVILGNSNTPGFCHAAVPVGSVVSLPLDS